VAFEAKGATGPLLPPEALMVTLAPVLAIRAGRPKSRILNGVRRLHGDFFDEHIGLS